MNIADTKECLARAGFKIKNEQRIQNDTGWKLQLENGGIVNIFDTGNMSVQGKCQPEVKAALNIPMVTERAQTKNKVFVVYGHDKIARDQLETMLRRWELNPLILEQLPSEGQTIIEKLQKYTSEGDFAVVLATPDDEGYRAGRVDEKAYRTRQNVVLELGMLLSRLGRSHVAILLKQQTNMERPSDIQGLIYIPFMDDLQKETGSLLAKEMVAQGYYINIANL